MQAWQSLDQPKGAQAAMARLLEPPLSHWMQARWGGGRQEWEAGLLAPLSWGRHDLLPEPIALSTTILKASPSLPLPSSAPSSPSLVSTDFQS